MTTPIPQLDATRLQAILNGDKPALLLFSRGDDLRAEFNIAYQKAAGENGAILFGQIHPDDHPQIAQQFEIGGQATMIAYYKGETLSRRVRPWGADVPLALELLHNVIPKTEPIEEPEGTPLSEEKPKVDNQPINVTDETFQVEVIDHDLPVVIDFWAPWCGPCRMVAPILEKLAGEYAGKLRIAKVNVDENPALSQTFQVMSIPTIMMVKERTIVFSQPGALPEQALRSLFDQLIALEIPAEAKESEEEEQPAN